jgi:hypothetical protein
LPKLAGQEEEEMAMVSSQVLWTRMAMEFATTAVSGLAEDTGDGDVNSKCRRVARKKAPGGASAKHKEVY